MDMQSEPAEKHPVDQAAEILEVTLEGLGELLNVSKGAVSQWKDEGRRVPPKHCPEIERLTGGRVRCEDLNDQVNWAYLRAHGEAHSDARAG